MRRQKTKRKTWPKTGVFELEKKGENERKEKEKKRRGKEKKKERKERQKRKKEKERQRKKEKVYLTITFCVSLIEHRKLLKAHFIELPENSYENSSIAS